MRHAHDTAAADLTGTYPASPGWSQPTTSREAARRFAGRSKLLRQRVLATLEEVPSGMSAHEIARRLALPPSAVQPRVSELRREGKIKPSGWRTKNDSGVSAHAWVLWPEGTPYVDAPSIAPDEEPR